MKTQAELYLFKGQKGGRRPGAGRPRIHSPGVAHTKRELVTSRMPFHINFKYKLFIQTNQFQKHLERGIQNAFLKGLYIAYYTIQSNHIHIIGEAENNESLSAGMKSLTTTIARAVSRGSIQIERYHLHVLKTPQETRNAINYVLTNNLKHTGKQNLKFTKKLNNGSCWLLKKASKSISS